MKKLFIVPLFFISIILYAQGTFTWTSQQCYKIIGDDTMKVDCEDVLPTPVFTGNIDSLCWEMEKRFVNTLNEWRRNHGLNELEYDYDMQSLLTVPWNESQVQAGKISHGEGYNSLRNRSNRVGIRGCGECCAFNYRSDIGEVSQFFIQYKNSSPHWKILTSDDYNYIAVSVLYDQETNRYYSVVNVRM
jgi:uncharacterized protein YkwD